MRRMRRLLIASLFAASVVAAPAAQDADLRSTASAASMSGVMTPPLSPRNANYTITARLDPATRTITGSETITWRNITGRPAADLQFHLYWNAWKNTRSTFMRERALGGGTDDRAPPTRRVGAHRRDRDHRRRRRSHRRQALHRAGRREPERRDGDVGAAARSRSSQAAARPSRSPGPRTCRAPSRAPARSATSSSSRSGFPSSACSRTTAGTAISSTPAPSSSPTTASTTCR